MLIEFPLISSFIGSLRQYYEGRLTELEEERELTVQQAVEAAVSLKLRKLQTRFEKGERESRDLQEVHSHLLSDFLINIESSSIKQVNMSDLVVNILFPSWATFVICWLLTSFLCSLGFQCFFTFVTIFHIFICICI